MAKSASRGIVLSKKASREADVEEVIDDTVDESQEEVTEVKDSNEDVKVSMMADLVTVSVFDDIKPAPTVGPISLVRDFGMSVLTKGVHKIPRSVAIVLMDKKLAQLVG